MPQVRIELDDALYAVLERYGEEECRLPTQQATYIVRQVLRSRVQQETALRHLEGGSVVPSVWTSEAGETAAKESSP